MVQKCPEYCYVLHNVFGPTIFKGILYWNSDTKIMKWKNKSVYSRYLRAQFRMFKSIGSGVRASSKLPSGSSSLPLKLLMDIEEQIRGVVSDSNRQIIEFSYTRIII